MKDKLAKQLYTVYCNAIGNKLFDGDFLLNAKFLVKHL